MLQDKIIATYNMSINILAFEGTRGVIFFPFKDLTCLNDLALRDIILKNNHTKCSTSINKISHGPWSDCLATVMSNS